MLGKELWQIVIAKLDRMPDTGQPVRQILFIANDARRR